MTPPKPTHDDLNDPDALSRGILTAGDRRFLKRGPSENTDEQTNRNTRYRIRERILVSLTDFLYLAYHLSDEDVEQIFERLSENEVLSQISISTFTFFYRGLEKEMLERYLETAAGKCERKKNPDEIVNVDVDIEVDIEDRDKVLDRIAQGEGTTSDFVSLASTPGGIDQLHQRLEQKGAPFELDNSSGTSPEEPLKVTKEVLDYLSDEFNFS